MGLGIPTFAYLCVAGLGGLVGAGELISRYQDAPRQAILSAPGLFYVLLNVLVSVLALAAVAILDAPADAAAGRSAEELLNLILASGLGAMALFRAKLITLRVGEKDVSVGPSMVLEVVLHAADRAVDRQRAEPRAQFVSQLMSQVSFEEAKLVLPSYCFALMQNVPVEEEQRIGLDVAALSTADMPDRVKALNLGLMLLNVVGETVLEIAVQNLKDEFAAATGTLKSVDDTLSQLDFERASRNLTPLCARMADMAEEEYEGIEFEIQKLRAGAFSERTRLYLYGLILIRTFGADIVNKAIEAIRDDLVAEEPPPPADAAA